MCNKDSCDGGYLEKVWLEEEENGLIKPILNPIVNMNFPDVQKSIDAGECPMCHAKIRKEDFKTLNDINEYGISGLCQKCIDEIFNSEVL